MGNHAFRKTRMVSEAAAADLPFDLAVKPCVQKCGLERKTLAAPRVLCIAINSWTKAFMTSVFRHIISIRQNTHHASLLTSLSAVLQLELEQARQGAHLHVSDQQLCNRAMLDGDGGCYSKWGGHLLMNSDRI